MPPFLEEVHGLARHARVPLGDGADASAVGVDELGLTERELEVLRLLGDGRINRQIGEELFITPKTASVHVSRILMKLGVANRAEATAATHRMGLVTPARRGLAALGFPPENLRPTIGRLPDVWLEVLAIAWRQVNS